MQNRAIANFAFCILHFAFAVSDDAANRKTRKSGRLLGSRGDVHQRRRRLRRLSSPNRVVQTSRSVLVVGAAALRDSGVHPRALFRRSGESLQRARRRVFVCADRVRRLRRIRNGMDELDRPTDVAGVAVERLRRVVGAFISIARRRRVARDDHHRIDRHSRGDSHRRREVRRGVDLRLHVRQSDSARLLHRDFVDRVSS